MYKWGEIVNNYVILFYGDRWQLIMMITLKYLSNLYVVYKQLSECLKSLKLQKQTYRKRDQICDFWKKGWGDSVI